MSRESFSYLPSAMTTIIGYDEPEPNHQTINDGIRWRNAHRKSATLRGRWKLATIHHKANQMRLVGEVSWSVSAKDVRGNYRTIDGDKFFNK